MPIERRDPAGLSAETPPAERSAGTGLARGLRRKCPNCGVGPLFRGYLKVRETCPECGHENGRYRADDGPAYITILLIGHVLIAPALFFPIMWEADPRIVIPISLATVFATTLLLLPFVKGGFVGVLWSAGKIGDQ